MRLTPLLSAFLVCLITPTVNAQDDRESTWPQWRGPTRDGQVAGMNWPDSISSENLTPLWHVDLPPSYSGPIVSKSAVFVTATENELNESVMALDRKSGQQLWKADWPGSMKVPFFAASNGSWIRSTPALDGDYLFVAGMRDVLVALDANTGREIWRVDFVSELNSPLPAFGFVSSPLVDGDSLYVQAAASVVKLEKATGKILWRALQDAGGMMGSAFSSPVIANLAGQRQLLVQTREKLAGLKLDSGEVLWQQDIPSFRGMNILTPTVYGDAVFTSSYQNKSWLFQLAQGDDNWQVKELWKNNAQAYMSTPVIVDGHAYMHLQNQRFSCVNLATGEQTWISRPFGKYCSLVCQGNQLLALDERGKLLLIKCDPREFTLVGEVTVSEDSTWAHLAICGDEVLVRALNGLHVFRWQSMSPQ